MENHKYHMLGNLMSEQGAIAFAKDMDGLIQLQIDIAKLTLQANGIKVTPQIEQEISLYFQLQQEKYDQELYAKGIPEKLQTLFDYSKKSKVIAYCKRITVTEDELFLLMNNCNQIEYKHKSKFPEYVPESRILTKKDRTELIKANPQKFSNKLKSIFEERKHYMVHLFENSEKWHCFYYTYKDMESNDKNHWKYGTHLHYVSYLWSEYSKRKVWESFDERENDIQSVHIKLELFPENNQEDNELRELTKILVEKYKQL